jgi:hypothetical protein
MDTTKQRQSVEVGRGLFLVRYTEAEDESRPPRVEVSADPDAPIEFHLHPDHQDAVLWQPGSSLIVEATEPTQFVVRVVPGNKDGSVAATVKIETLTQGKPLEPYKKGRVNAPVREAASTNDLGSFRILGHLAGIGDLWVDANEWLGGPGAPSRLEGISIEWPDKPSDLVIRYAVRTAKPQPNSGKTMQLGTFAGTRGKSMPIVTLMLELAGPEASVYRLSADAIFLGTPVKHFTGRRIVISAPTGREPLVGLRVNLESTAAPKSLTKSSASKPARSSGRVRVFRSRANADQPETA